MPETLIICENVGKRFCRDLKKSLWYGVTDSVSSVFGSRRISPTMQAAESISEQSLREGEFWANSDISFTLKRGKCLGIIGHNGAGKTTLLKMLNGLIRPDAGRICIKGTVGALIALGAGFNPILTGRENVFINSSVLGYGRAQTRKVFDEIVAFAELEDAIDAPVQTYSSGMKVRLGFAIAAQMNPDIMLVDEVLAVGDNAFQKKCYDRIYELRENGTSFVVVSHNPYQLERLCDSVAAMSGGRILKLAEPKEAIHLYHSELRKHAPVKAREIADLREGTGEARVESVTLIDHVGNQSSEIETGRNFRLRAKCRFKEAIVGLRIRFTIYSDSNTQIANLGSNSVADSWQFDKGDHTIEFNANYCALLNGVYTVEVVLVSTRGERIDRINEAIAFSVVTRDPAIIDQTAGCGIVHVRGNWSLDKEAEKTKAHELTN